MNEHETPVVDEVKPKHWYRHELILFIGGSVVVAFLLVLVSMAIYASSGAAQLDLSRPGYKSVQSQLDQSDTFQAFSADGTVNKNDLDQFQRLYQKQVKSVNDSDVYTNSALDDQALGIDAPAAGE